MLDYRSLPFIASESPYLESLRPDRQVPAGPIVEPHPTEDITMFRTVAVALLAASIFGAPALAHDRAGSAAGVRHTKHMHHVKHVRHGHGKVVVLKHGRPHHHHTVKTVSRFRSH